MPKFDLFLEAECENVESITLSKNTKFILSFKCTKCGDEKANVELDQQCVSEIPGSRGTAQLVIVCKDCKQSNSMDIISLQEFNCKIYDRQKVATLQIRGSLLPVAWSWDSAVVKPTAGPDLELQGGVELIEWVDEIEGNVNVLSISTTVQ